MIDTLSPMMQHYMQVKEKNKDRIVFYRVGDFYEMFFDDAELVSQELDLTLTGKECGREERAPMCGVPHHSAEAYIKRLVDKGYKVAVCEQTEDAALAKGLVERQVVRVVTPGTVIEDSMLVDDRNNFLASIWLKSGTAGLCFADISTGRAYATVLTGDNLAQAINSELARFSPSEILLNDAMLDYTDVADFIKHTLQCSVELLDDSEFAESEAKTRLQTQFGVQAQGWFDVPAQRQALQATGALIGYLGATQVGGVQRIKTLNWYTTEEYMDLSPTSRMNLELTETMRTREKKGSLLWVLDKTSTAMGKRMLRQWIEKPLMNADVINQRLDGVESLFSHTVPRLELVETLSPMADLERLMTRVIYGSATPRELRALEATCASLPALQQQLKTFECGTLQQLNDWIDPLEDLQRCIDETLQDELPAAVSDGGVIRDGFNDEVDELRCLLTGSKETLAKMEQELKEETDIRTLRIKFNKVFGYFIEVSKSYMDDVPEHFIRKQTLTNAERYFTEELKELENKILGAGERLNVLERTLFDKLLGKVREQDDRIQRTAEAVATLDVYCSLAQVASVNKYVRPLVDSGDVVDITAGRHPVVELTQQHIPFVPNDTKLDGDDNRMQVITGPNMAGKSTYMRQVALIVVMAQLGSFIPADAGHIGVCDAVFTRVGASDDLSQGRSTFMVEMTELAEILDLATDKSLVILDEIGRGTSTFDGMSIAQSVIEYITDRDLGPGCKTLFATHYHELTDLENSVDGVKNYNIIVKKRGDEIIFLRRIVRGAADDSYGIEVANLAGIPATVLDRAKQVLKTLERSSMGVNKVAQLDFESYEEMQTTETPLELVERLKTLDPETLTPIEALNLVYELKNIVDES